MEKRRHTFKKEERLRGQLKIAQLFDKGQTFLVYPIKVVWLSTDEERQFPVQAAFAVSKKNFKLASRRNLLKRRMKEAYRLNKHILPEKIKQKSINMVFIYIANEELPYFNIEKSMKTVLWRLTKL